MSSRNRRKSGATRDHGLYRLVDTRHGAFLANPNDIYVGRALIEFGEFSELESDVIRQGVTEGGVAVEVGANIGAHTVAMARKAGPAGRVHAFEPQPVIFQNLCANLALNGLTNVYCYNMACGEACETMTFPDIDYGAANNFGGVDLTTLSGMSAGQRVRIAPLDEFDLPGLHFLKIDAEGMECDVIRGARRTIARHKPTLYVENDRLDRSEALILLIRELGYRLWWHMPPLYNPENWAGNRANPWPGIVSYNMLAVHESRATNIDGLTEVGDASDHPLRRACA